MNSDWFNPTQDEIKEAESGGRPVFKNGDEYTFLVTEIKESINSDGSPRLDVASQVIGGDNDQKKHTFFIRQNSAGKGMWINMLKAFFDDATITSGTLTPTSLVGKQMKSVCKQSKSKDGTKIYDNFYQFEEAGGAPNLHVVDQASDIPF